MRRLQREFFALCDGSGVVGYAFVVRSRGFCRAVFRLLPVGVPGSALASALR